MWNSSSILTVITEDFSSDIQKWHREHVLPVKKEEWYDTDYTKHQRSFPSNTSKKPSICFGLFGLQRLSNFVFVMFTTLGLKNLAALIICYLTKKLSNWQLKFYIEFTKENCEKFYENLQHYHWSKSRSKSKCIILYITLSYI